MHTLWLIYVVVWQKPIQHCKGIIHQLKINFKNGNWGHKRKKMFSTKVARIKFLYMYF